jgi:putative transposase
MGYSRAAYYKAVRVIEMKEIKSEMIFQMVLEWKRLMKNIGGKKLYDHLKHEIEKLDGPRIGRDKFFNILRERGLLVKKKRKYAKTTNSYHRFHTYKNIVKNTELTGPDQAVASDITYLRTEKCFLYLSLQTDLYSRKITGWDLSISLSVEGSIRALGMTIKQSRNPNGMIHHSDRGIQYCCKAYIEKLRKYKMQISMTEENHCYENAVAERINGILKQEFDLDSTFRNYKEAYKAVKQAIFIYNNYRKHWSLDLSTPMQIHNAA